MKLKFIVGILLVMLLLTACGDDVTADADTDTVGTSSGVETPGSETEADETTEEIIDYPEQIIPDDGEPREAVWRRVSAGNDRYGYDEGGRLVYVRNKNELEPYIELTYDEEGYLSEIFDKSKDGGYRWKYFFERGLYIGYETYSFSGELRPYTVVRYTYNSDGTVASYLHANYQYMDTGDIYSQNEELTEYGYVYDDAGRLIEKYTTFKDETYLSAKYVYDSDGKLVFEYEYSTDGCTDAIEYAYDGEGRVVSKKSYDADKHYVSKFEYYFEYKLEYDDAGNLLRNEYYNAQGERIQLNEYEYDGEGRVIFYKYETSGFMPNSYSEEYLYDDNGNLIKTLNCKTDDGAGLETEYTYREFMLTEAEREEIEENDALIREYINSY